MNIDQHAVHRDSEKRDESRLPTTREPFDRVPRDRNRDFEGASEQRNPEDRIQKQSPGRRPERSDHDLTRNHR